MGIVATCRTDGVTTGRVKEDGLATTWMTGRSKLVPA
jgi:hypothetical protein